MLRKINYLTMLALLPIPAGSTSFIPVPLEMQIQNSHGVVRGKMVRATFKKLKTGEIITESTFQLHSTAGIPHHEIINKNNFKIIHPGGSWQGMVQHIPGAPKFKQGEEVVLLLVKSSYGFTPANLELSRYSLYRKHSRVFLRNSVFPDHPGLGKIPFDEFNNLLEKRFGAPLQTLNLDRYIHKAPPPKRNKKSRLALAITPSVKRAPASLQKTDPPKKRSLPHYLLWPTLLLALLGAFSGILTQFQKKYKK